MKNVWDNHRPPFRDASGCAHVIAAGASPARTSMWSTLSGYQCGGTLGGQHSSLAAAKRACADNPRCTGVYDDGRGGLALCDSTSLHAGTGAAASQPVHVRVHVPRSLTMGCASYTRSTVSRLLRASRVQVCWNAQQMLPTAPCAGLHARLSISCLP